MRPAIFLDRDGTLIIDKGYLSDPADLELLPGVVEGLKLLKGAGFVLVVVTNQSGVGRGYFTEADVHRVHIGLLRMLHAHDVDLDAVYFSPQAPSQDETETSYRKPGAGMLLHAARDLGLDLSRSWMIGDALRDVEAGRNAGCRGILVETGREPLPDLAVIRERWPVAADFLAACRAILDR